MRSALLLLVSNVTNVYDVNEEEREASETQNHRDDDDDGFLDVDGVLREKMSNVVRVCESSAKMKTKLKDVTREKEADFVPEDGCEMAAVSWFPPVLDAAATKEDDGNACFVPWTKATNASSDSMGERLRLTRSKRSMLLAKKTAEDLFMEEVQTPTKKKMKSGGGKSTSSKSERKKGMVVLQRTAATEAMKLVDQVERKALSAMDIVCVVPIVLGKDVNAALFDMNDPGKWPESFILAHGVVKRAKERLGGEKVRVKIVPVYIVADDEDEEDERTKTSETRTEREALINARLEHVSNAWGFTSAVVVESLNANPVTVSDASVIWRGKLLIGGGLKTKLSSNAKNKKKNNSSKYKTYDRCIAAVEVSRECSQCAVPFLPMESNIIDDGEEAAVIKEERDGEKKSIIEKKAPPVKKSTTATTKKNTNNNNNRKNGGENEVEDEEETVLKINDIVLMSAIDAVDIDSSQAPRHVSFHPPPSESVGNSASNWMSAYASFCAKKHDEGVPGECPVLLCSIATAIPMVVARGKNGAVGTKGIEKKDDDFDFDEDNDNVRKKMRDKGAALVNRANNKYFPVQSRDERVFVLVPVFSKKKTTTSVTFRLVKLVDPRSALERRVLFPRTFLSHNQNGNDDGDEYCSSQPPLLALPGSDNRRLSAEEERLDEALKTVAKMVVARGGGEGAGRSKSKEVDEVSNKDGDDTFETIFRIVDDYFAKRARCRGGKASDEDESMREYCIAWMRFLYLTKKDASAIIVTSSTNVLFDAHRHQFSTKANNDKKMNDEAELNELKRFYDALEKSSKETADDIRHDVSLVSVLRSAAMDCEKKLESSETVARLLRSRMPSRNDNNISSMKRQQGRKGDDGKKRKKTGEENKSAAAMKKRAKKNTTTTTLITATTATASKGVSDKLAKLRGSGGGVVAGKLKAPTMMHNPMTTTTANGGSAPLPMRYSRNKAPSNGSALVAAATMSTDDASLEAWKYGMHRTAANAQGPTSFSGLGLNNNNNNNNNNTASLSQQRPSESGAGSGAIGARGTILCPNCNADLKLTGGMKFCPYCGGTLH